MSLLSPQQKYGQETIRRIQKASRPSIADAGIGILKSIQEGLQQRVKNNLERINTNFEDEEIRLTSLYNDYALEEKRVNELKTAGNGDLIKGIMLDKIKMVKEGASLDGLEAQMADPNNVNKDLFTQLRKEAEKEAIILQQRLDGLSQLRTTYDPKNPDEGIIATGVRTEAQFKQPIKDSIKLIALNQKEKGQNNVLDVMFSKLGMSTRDNYDMIQDFFDQENKVSEIIEATLAARDKLPVYEGDAGLLSTFITEENQAEKNKQAKSPEAIKQKFTKLMADSKQFVTMDLKLEGDGSFFFMPQRDVAAKKIRSFTEDDLNNFMNKFGYTKKDIVSLYYRASVMAQEAYDKNSNVLKRLKESNGNSLILSADVDKRLAGIEASELYNGLYGGNMTLVPEEKRTYIASVLDLNIPEVKKIDSDTYIQYQGQILTKVNTNFSEEKATLFANLDSSSKMAFNYAVIGQAKMFEATGVDQATALDRAMNVQKLGIVSGPQFTELFGAIRELDLPPAAKEEFLAQPYLAWNAKEQRFIQPILDQYPRDKVLAEDTIESFIEQINKQPVYKYLPETMMNKNPKKFPVGTRYIIGQAIVTFDGDNWVRTQ